MSLITLWTLVACICAAPASVFPQEGLGFGGSGGGFGFNRYPGGYGQFPGSSGLGSSGWNPIPPNGYGYWPSIPWWFRRSYGSGGFPGGYNSISGIVRPWLQGSGSGFYSPITTFSGFNQQQGNGNSPGPRQ